MTRQLTKRRLAIWALSLGCLGAACALAPAAEAQGRGSADPSSGVPPRRSFGNDMPPGGAGSFNPTGPSPSNPPGSIAPMPPGGRGSFNPTGPQPGAPSGYVPPMPPGGSGSFNATGPIPQPNIDDRPNSPRRGVNSPRLQPPTTRSGKAAVAPGLEPCLEGWNPKRGLSQKDHRALCEKIWKTRQPSS